MHQYSTTIELYSSRWQPGCYPVGAQKGVVFLLVLLLFHFVRPWFLRLCDRFLFFILLYFFELFSFYFHLFFPFIFYNNIFIILSIFLNKSTKNISFYSPFSVAYFFFFYLYVTHLFAMCTHYVLL